MTAALASLALVLAIIGSAIIADVRVRRASVRQRLADLTANRLARQGAVGREAGGGKHVVRSPNSLVVDPK